MKVHRVSYFSAPLLPSRRRSKLISCVPMAQERPQKKQKKSSSSSKRLWKFQPSYVERFGLLIQSRDSTTGSVDSAICRFCSTYGRETAPGVSRKRQKTKVPQMFTKNKFNPSNIQKHLREQHPKKWEEYIGLRDRDKDDAEATKKFDEFFQQSVLHAFFNKTAHMQGTTTFSLNKDVVEVAVKELLVDGQEKLDGDLAMRAFVPVKDDAGNVLSYTVTIKRKAQFDHVLELVAAGLSFRQIEKVVRSDRVNLGASGKLPPVSPGEASNLARLACAIGFQYLSEIMNESWAFSIGADESNNDGQDSHLDVRIRFPPDVGYQGSAEVDNGFHLIAIPLSDRAHSGRVYCDLLVKLLDSLCGSWRMKLLGSSTDGAGNMTGHNSGFSTLLRNESMCPEAFYRLWCLCHQLDVVVKKAVTMIDETGVFEFMKTLTEGIAYLRRQKNLIAKMGSKSPYYITVRWKSLHGVTVWWIEKCTDIVDHMEENRFAHTPSKAWYVLAIAEAIDNR